MEAIIHTRALTLFGSISRLEESSTEKSLARRQLSVKPYAGNSWFVEIRRLCVKYSLPDPYSILDNSLQVSMKKSSTKSNIHILG